MATNWVIVTSTNTFLMEGGWVEWSKGNVLPLAEEIYPTLKAKNQYGQQHHDAEGQEKPVIHKHKIASSFNRNT